MVKISEKTLKDIREARRQGKTYRQIELEFHVSRWTTTNYLQGFDPKNANLISKSLENEAIKVLEQNGFKINVKMKDVSPNSSTDLVALKDTIRWLINIRHSALTIYSDGYYLGSNKVIPGFRTGILVIDENHNHPPIFLEITNIPLVKIKQD